MKNVIEMNNLVHVGKPAVFYLPMAKLGKEFMGDKFSDIIHEFIMQNCGAYVFDVTNSNCYWNNKKENLDIGMGSDGSAKYEVTIWNKISLQKIINFLSDLCIPMCEDYIYLNYDGNNYFIVPKAAK